MNGSGVAEGGYISVIMEDAAGMNLTGGGYGGGYGKRDIQVWWGVLSQIHAGNYLPDMFRKKL